MKRFDVELTGKTPLLVHRFTDEDQISATSGSRSSSQGNRGEPHDLAEKCLYIGNSGQPVLPGPNIFRGFVSAGKFFKEGRRQVTTTSTSLLYGVSEIDDVLVDIIHDHPWKVDTRPVRIPATGGRILRHRPCFDDWRLRFTMTHDESGLDEKVMYEIIAQCGRAIGLGDFRPECKGPFGKFFITKWEELKT